MPTTLNDSVLQEDVGIIGLVELKFVASWDRVEAALGDLPHGPVRYRWKTDSSGEMALFIEIPVPTDVEPEALLERRERLQESLNEAEGNRPVYIHFLDSNTPVDALDA